MRIRIYVLGLVASACFSSAVQAEAPKLGKMKAFREALMESCKSDISTLCPGKERHALMACLHENHEKLSDGCKKMLPNPEEMKKKLEAAKAACKDDIAQFCAGKEKRELMMCMHHNHDKLSEGCKTALPHPFEHKLDQKTPPQPAN